MPFLFHCAPNPLLNHCKRRHWLKLCLVVQVPVSSILMGCQSERVKKGLNLPPPQELGERMSKNTP